ncbi:hypothetical protein RND71_003364 [Anisodus tanguticus]|uniref:Uncharacterized protein n=1 Tax=Anisodus tanguticus TaxID=243964 RepID=A0AAE1ST56_9SOLA|nr:hypothetical protein RND71_003364 [Anisodus tanguticus]
MTELKMEEALRSDRVSEDSILEKRHEIRGSWNTCMKHLALPIQKDLLEITGWVGPTKKGPLQGRNESAANSSESASSDSGEYYEINNPVNYQSGPSWFGASVFSSGTDLLKRKPYCEEDMLTESE